VLASKKFISLPIISLKEGQQIGYVRNLVIDPKTKSIAALIIDPKGFFKDQRIIPFNRVINIGENAITISTESQVEKATNLPDIMNLLKEKSGLIGIKVINENGKTLGITEEFYIDCSNGNIASLELSGGIFEGFFNGRARLNTDDILTIGPDVIIVYKDSESRMIISNKGINKNVKSFIQKTSDKASEKGKHFNRYIKKIDKKKKDSACEEFTENHTGGAVNLEDMPSTTSDPDNLQIKVEFNKNNETNDDVEYPDIPKNS